MVCHRPSPVREVVATRAGAGTTAHAAARHARATFVRGLAPAFSVRLYGRRPSSGRITLTTTGDIAAPRTAETALHDTTDTFETAFSQAPTGVALIGLDGRFARVNAALCEMLGRSEDELVGSP